MLKQIIKTIKPKTIQIKNSFYKVKQWCTDGQMKTTIKDVINNMLLITCY